MNHPDAAEWMAYLYAEVAPDRKRKLRAHLDVCADCSRQLSQWRLGMAALDEWKLPAAHRTPGYWQPVLKWAAAAVVILGVGFAIGRQGSPSFGEVRTLKASVAQLTEKVEGQHTAASDGMIQLLSDYAKLNEQQRTQDRRAVTMALRDMEMRLVKLRTELETVAVNTESGFQQTQEGLTQLASYTTTGRSGPTDFKSPDTK